MSEEIGTIKLSGVNNGAHYNFVSSVAEKARTESSVYDKVKDLVDELARAVAAENDALMLSRKNAKSDLIATADRQRDAFFRGYRNSVRSFLHFPDGAQKEAASVLWQHLTDHGIDPQMQLDRETGLMTNLVEDLTGRLAPQVAVLSLTPFVTGMKQENDKVRKALSARDAELSTRTFGALKAARKKSDEAYQAVVRRVNAHAEIEGDALYLPFIRYVNEQIRRFKEQVIASPAKRKGGKSGETGKSGQSASHAEELARLKAMIAEYEQSSHFTPGIVQFTGLAAGKDATRAYQVYLSDQPTDLFWLTMKDGRLAEIEFKVQPGQSGGLAVEKIK